MKKILSEKEWIITVDYSQTLKRMITNGNYDWIHSDITKEHFPLPTKLIGWKLGVSIKLFHFSWQMSNKDVIAEMNKGGYRPAILAELLVLGETNPKLQSQFPIIALGSVWQDTDDDCNMPFLYVRFNERELNLNQFDNDLSIDYRFLAVHKSSDQGFKRLISFSPNH